MARKRKKDGISQDERMVIDQFSYHLLAAAEWMDAHDDEPEDEPLGVNQLGFDAQVELLSRLYSTIGEEKLEQLKQIIDMSLDSDFRCPK